MNIESFIRERRPAWNRLERLLDTAENSPEWELGHERVRDLVTLYRQACSDLNQARSRTANPELLDHLNQLTGRAYRFLYAGSLRRAVRQSVGNFLLVDAPAAFQANLGCVLLAAAALALGTLAGFSAVLLDPSSGEALIPAAFYRSSPREYVQQIESSQERVDSAGTAAVFGTFLFTHNIQVTCIAFSLCALTIVAGLALIFYQGLFLGAVAAMFYIDGVELFFLGWVGPHGALELPAIVFGGAAGLAAGRALLMPGNLTRGAAVRQVFPTVWRMMLVCAIMLVVAGLIEGSFSQFSSRTVAYEFKIAVAASLFVAMVGVLFVRRPGRGRDSLSRPHEEPA